MPFTEEEINKLVGLFEKGNLNQFSLIIVEKVFLNLTDIERKNWFEKILDHCEKVISKNEKIFEEKKEQVTTEQMSAAARSFITQLYNKFNTMAQNGKFKVPPQ